MTPRFLLCVRIFLNGLFLAPPLVGVLLAGSTAWDVVWWVVFGAWVSLFIAGSRDPGLVGIGVSLAAAVAVVEVDPRNSIWFYAAGLFITIALSSSFRIYREQAPRTLLTAMRWPTVDHR